MAMCSEMKEQNWCNGAYTILGITVPWYYSTTHVWCHSRAPEEEDFLKAIGNYQPHKHKVTLCRCIVCCFFDQRLKQINITYARSALSCGGEFLLPWTHTTWYRLICCFCLIKWSIIILRNEIPNFHISIFPVLDAVVDVWQHILNVANGRMVRDTKKQNQVDKSAKSLG